MNSLMPDHPIQDPPGVGRARRPRRAERKPWSMGSARPARSARLTQACTSLAHGAAGRHALPPVASRLAGRSSLWEADLQRRRSGSVLILALWVLFFLAALALAVGAHVSAALTLAGFMRQDVRGYHLARAGVTHAAMRVACNTNRWDAGTEGAWNADPDVFSDQVVGDIGAFSIIHTQQTPEGTVTHVGLVGAESRLDLNRADELIFEQVMIRVGHMGGAQADALYKALRAYREAKQQHLLTIRAARGYGEPDSGGVAPLDSVHELLLVEGMDDGVFALIEPYITVYGSGRINANTASTELLLSCADAYPKAKERIGEILAEREGAPLTQTSDLGSIAFLTVGSTAFYGTAVGQTATGGEAARIQFVVDSSGQRQYWHEF